MERGKNQRPGAERSDTSAATPAKVEAELQCIQAEIAATDQKLAQIPAGAERYALLDARDALVERLQELAALLPSTPDDADPGPDNNVVDLFGSHTRDGRRNILVSPAIHEMVEGALEVFAEANLPPTIFQRANRLVRFTTDPLTGEPSLADLGPANFAVELSRIANFCKRGYGKDGEPVLQPVQPPSIVVQAMMEAPPRTAPPIRRISRCPYMRVNGYIVREKGYQSVERVYLAEDFTRSVEVPERPTAADVSAATALICNELLGDFPFAHASDKAHAVAMLLEPVVAELIAGPNPFHVIEASVIDSGKTQLGDVVSGLARGRKNSWLNFAGEKEEQTKMLSAALLKLPSIVAIDNVKVDLDLPLLEAALTGSVEVRILGTSELSPALDTRGTTFLATVNNATLSDDLVRRSVRSRLEPATDRPGERVFKHPELFDWVVKNRAAILAALLTLVKNWMVRQWDRPEPYRGRRLSSFGRWSEVMGGILEYSEIDGFLDDRAIRHEMRSDGSTEWLAFVDAWHRQFGYGHVTARKLLDELVAPPTERYTKDGATYRMPAESVTLLPDSMGATRIESRTKKLGHLLRNRRGQIFGGLKIRSGHDASGNANAYWLEDVQLKPKDACKDSDDPDLCR